MQWKGVIINVPFLKFGGLRFGDSLDFVIPHSAKWPALGRCPGNIADSLALIRSLVLDRRLNI